MLSKYSYSALKTFQTCPAQFKFQYIDKVAVPKKITADTYLGNVVHRVLNKLYKLGADGIVLPKEEMLTVYHDEWKKVDRDSITVSNEYYDLEDYVRRGEEMLLSHYEQYQPFRQGTLLGTELEIYFQLPGTPSKFNARIDRLWKRDDGVVEICDYKTGQHLTKVGDRDFRQQMGLYQLAVREHFPHFETIEVAQYFLRMNEVIAYRFRPEELDELSEEIRTIVFAIMHAEETNNFPPSESPLCSYCNYYHLCPAKLHEQLLKEEDEDTEQPTPESLARQAHTLASKYIEVDTEQKQLKAKRDVLREEVIRIAKQLEVTSLVGDKGTVRITSSKKEEFVKKSKEPQKHAELSHLAREWGLEEYFTLDDKALMKELHQKHRLSPEQMETLKSFVRTVESAIVRVKLNQPEEEEEE